MAAGLPADMRRAQSGQVPCSDALARQGKVLDEVSAAILADAQASARTSDYMIFRLIPETINFHKHCCYFLGFF